MGTLTATDLANKEESQMVQNGTVFKEVNLFKFINMCSLKEISIIAGFINPVQNYQLHYKLIKKENLSSQPLISVQHFQRFYIE